jgi:uncharacterized protein involved in cysteine biosynthesis
MTTVLISGLATACILTAVEGLLINLGKWRGLVSLLLSILFCINLGTKLRYLTAYTLAATFVGLTLSYLVEQLFTGVNPRTARGLPNRIPRR